MNWWCEYMGHLWSAHTLGKHCRICKLTKKEYWVIMEDKVDRKNCEVCRWYAQCYSFDMSPNYDLLFKDPKDFREACMLNKHSEFVPSERYKKYDRTDNNPDDTGFIRS